MITTNSLEKIARRFRSRRQRGGGEACEGWDEAVLGGPQPRLLWHQEVILFLVLITFLHHLMMMTRWLWWGTVARGSGRDGLPIRGSYFHGGHQSKISGRGCGAQGIPNIPKCENHSMGEGDHWNRRSCG